MRGLISLCSLRYRSSFAAHPPPTVAGRFQFRATRVFLPVLFDVIEDIGGFAEKLIRTFFDERGHSWREAG
jgi:hypothetical protein